MIEKSWQFYGKGFNQHHSYDKHFVKRSSGHNRLIYLLASTVKVIADRPFSTANNESLCLFASTTYITEVLTSAEAAGPRVQTWSREVMILIAAGPRLVHRVMIFRQLYVSVRSNHR